MQLIEFLRAIVIVFELKSNVKNPKENQSDAAHQSFMPLRDR